jgi:cytochrome c
MAGIGAHYPKWDADAGRPINIELQINKCREENMGAEPYAFDKGGQKPLTAFIKHQSLGDPVRSTWPKATCSPGGTRARSSTTPDRPVEPVLRQLP